MSMVYGRPYLKEKNATRMFRLWRGSIIYRFKIIKTKYHKGRIRLTWDPEKDNSLLADTETTCFTQLIDLDDTDEFEFEVPYKAKQNFLDTSSVDPSWIGSHASYPTAVNGYINLRVQNILSSPIGTAAIQILVFQRPGSDFQFAQPNELPMNLTYSALQSTSVVDGKTNKRGDHITDISVGEKIDSLRPLLHRTSLSFQQILSNAAGDQLAGTHFTTVGIPRTPPMYGPQQWGDMAMYYPPSSSHPGQLAWGFFCTTHTIAWVLQCLVGYRGSIVCSANVCGGSRATGRRIESASLERLPVTHQVKQDGSYTKNVLTTIQANPVQSQFSSLACTFGPYPSQGWTKMPTGQRGMTVTKEITQSALTAVSPQYLRSRMLIVDPNDPGAGEVGYDGSANNFRLDVIWTAESDFTTGAMPFAQIFYAAGVDFNPVFFNNTPALS